ncbi:MAG: nitrogen fixation protein NifZ [Campylobacterales bacterium]|nr:nitrogen fixation protein NifZ [Campylobacterales bacterium]
MLTSSTKDEILSRFHIGQKVRLVKDIRNDGTFPYAKMGEILVRAGDEGFVRDVGDFLQTIRVYEVNFMGANRIYGCREFELEALEEDLYEKEVEEELAWIKRHRETQSKQKES